MTMLESLAIFFHYMIAFSILYMLALLSNKSKRVNQFINFIFNEEE